MDINILTPNNHVCEDSETHLKCTFSYHGGNFTVYISKDHGCASWCSGSDYLDYYIKKAIVKQLKTMYKI